MSLAVNNLLLSKQNKAMNKDSFRQWIRTALDFPYTQELYVITYLKLSYPYHEFKYAFLKSKII